MPLHLELKPGEKIFISGAVIVNGESRCQISLLNDVPILREKDILTAELADTPCKKLYLAVQLMYMDSPNVYKYHQNFWSLVQDILTAAPSCRDQIEGIGGSIILGDYYHALKICKQLIAYERELIDHVK